MTSRQWRVIFGAVALGCTLAVAQPAIQESSPIVVAILVIVAGVAGYLKAPPDLDDPAA